MIRFTLDGKPVSTTAAGIKPLLRVLREDMQLTGTQFGGGIGEVGLPPVAPAMADTIAKLTGQRLRTLPFPATVTA